MNPPTHNHLDLPEADRLRRAESRWLEQARERLRLTARSSRPKRPENSTSKENDR
jgi:hypothetical protein